LKELFIYFKYIFQETYTERVFLNTWTLFRELWYYGILGALAAVLFSQVLSQKNIRSFFTGTSYFSILCGTLIGVFSPMCTFAAIPLVGGLIVAGVPLPPLMAFLISSPLMNPSLFIMTWGVIGPEMAIARTLSALFLGLVGGVLIKKLLLRGCTEFSYGVRESFIDSGALPVCIFDMKNVSVLVQIGTFVRHSRQMFWFIMKYYFMGLFIAGIVQALVNPQWIAALLGGESLASTFLAGLLGVPLYVCGGGSVATIGVLLSMGMGRGAALAFFVTGPATKISTLFSLSAVLKKRVAMVYLLVTLMGGVLLGYCYSFIASDAPVRPGLYGDIEELDNTLIFMPND